MIEFHCVGKSKNGFNFSMDLFNGSLATHFADFPDGISRITPCVLSINGGRQFFVYGGEKSIPWGTTPHK